LLLKYCKSNKNYFTASNPQNYFSKRDRLCGEIYLEYTVQRFDEVKSSLRSISVDTFHDDGPEGETEAKVEDGKSKGK